jgi:uncharacterized protein YrrD
MLTLGQALIGKNVMSLRNGSPIGRITGVVINPNNLKIEGWFTQDTFSRRPLILLTQDVRDFIPQGFVVNDHDDMSPPTDLVRLKPVLDIHFEIVDRQVITENKNKLGKVTDYAFDKDTGFIEKLYVGQSMLKSFGGGTKMIDRSQIVEVTDRKIVVKEALVTDPTPVPAAVPAQ